MASNVWETLLPRAVVDPVVGVYGHLRQIVRHVLDVRAGFGDIETESGVRVSLAEHSGQPNVIYRIDGKGQAVYAVALVYGPQGIVVYAVFVQASTPEINGISLADALRYGKEVGLVNVQFQRDGAVASVDGGVCFYKCATKMVSYTVVSRICQTFRCSKTVESHPACERNGKVYISFSCTLDSEKPYLS